MTLKACAAEYIAAATDDRAILIIDALPAALDAGQSEWLKGVLERHDQAIIATGQGADAPVVRFSSAIRLEAADGAVRRLAA